MGPWRHGWVGTGIALPAPTRLPHTPGTPPPTHTAVHVHGWCRAEHKVAVGLKSVAQLTSRRYFSDLRLMTEVYNLVKVDNR